MTREQVRAAFPELDEMEDAGLRAGVEDAWVTAMDENGIDDLNAVPWFPPAQREHDIPMAAELLVPHVRDVTRAAVALADSLAATRGADIDRDLVLAGGLVHDVSKLYEFEVDGAGTAVGDLLGHPHYAVHVTEAAGLPVELAHVALSHSGLTSVEPAFLEAVLVRRADEAAAAAITFESAGENEAR